MKSSYRRLAESCCKRTRSGRSLTRQMSYAWVLAWKIIRTLLYIWIPALPPAIVTEIQL